MDGGKGWMRGMGVRVFSKKEERVLVLVRIKGNWV